MDKEDKEDKTRHFIVGSVYLEVVTPLFQQKLYENYKSLNFGCLKDFLDNKAVIHILFHLRHRNARCCTDKANCTNQGALPLNHHQWKQLYAENPGPGIHNCFCKYTANSVKLKDLDLSLCGLILFNCCNLGQLDQDAVHILRRNKNDYLSHNTKCGITKDEYDTVMDELKTNVLQLDQTKEDELIRIQKRPLDDALCNKYMTILLDIHEIFEKIDNKIELIRDKMNINNDQLTAKIEEALQNAICYSCKEKLNKQETKEQKIKTYKLGQPIFTLHHQTDLTSAIGNDLSTVVSDKVMMDDGRLVLCIPDQHILLICDIDGSKVDRIHLKNGPWSVAAVNDYTVAVLMLIDSIEMYDINNKLKLKSISVPGMWQTTGITTTNNKLVVFGQYKLLIIDHQTGEVVQTIETECIPNWLHGSGDRILYCDNNFYNTNNNKLHCYSYLDGKNHNLTLPSQPFRMTTLQDGSLYVVCMDKSVQHVSSDVTQYETVTTKGLKELQHLLILHNSKQRKLVTNGDQRLIFNVFYEE
ncbi:uncharacterized protein LOC127736680 [Mytilus californianus]|uniref:uncharacterized protein LOC127736680 n=1 Tax=Mytilus californianus TaxID=6549 RepID=UPI002247762A|nr:uncharacterized protein LOC127736680 [Mytilus californianus]